MLVQTLAVGENMFENNRTRKMFVLQLLFIADLGTKEHLAITKSLTENKRKVEINLFSVQFVIYRTSAFAESLFCDCEVCNLHMLII